MGPQGASQGFLLAWRGRSRGVTHTGVTLTPHPGDLGGAVVVVVVAVRGLCSGMCREEGRGAEEAGGEEVGGGAGAGGITEAYW